MIEQTKANECGAVMLLISSYGQPLALVAAESLQQAQDRAVELLRGDQGRKMGRLTRDAVVTLFSAVVVAGGEPVAYLPTHVGSSRGTYEGSARDIYAASGKSH